MTDPEKKYHPDESAELARLRRDYDTLLSCIDDVPLSLETGSLRVLDISPVCERVLGYSAGDIVTAAEGLRQYIHQDDRKILDQHLTEICHDQLYRKQCRIVHRDGTIRWIELKCRPAASDGGMLRLEGIIKDITRLKKANIALMESEHLFRQFFDRAHEAILVLDMETGLMCDYNQTALELFGISGTEMLSQSPASLSVDIQPDGTLSAEASRYYVERTMRGERPVFEHLFRHAAGGGIPCEVRLSLVAVDGRTLIRSSIIDITERRKAEAEVRALNESLEQKVKDRTAELVMANNQLEAFSYTVSHDLQAPLRAICGFARILLEENNHQLDKSGQEMLRTIDRSGIRMSHLIRDLLDFARLGRAQCHKEETDMDSVLGLVLHELRQDQPHCRAEFHTSPLGSAICDTNLIRQVWINLVSNAVKYSSKTESPRIEIGTIVMDDTTVYYIRDNGAGFDMKYAKKLFTVFKRMHSEEEFEGTGIGLATVSNIILRHGGRIWAEAKPGQGATFYFTLS